ncbi:MAG: radical SAM family heme chaperone HemW [Bacteroidia bacterium]|nr:radical SAM family heme chaperone HemW [Bacteroidia bacterium]MDW8416459.1 radical SAM family heme chaperone HemW [Bacteroidia bacterium]
MFPDWIKEASLTQVETLGLYIHVPFCRRACHYCDFYFTPRASLMEEYVWALLQEIEAYASILGAYRIETVFFGGGTPSWLPPKLWERIFTRLSALPTFSPVEITIEANPEDIHPDNIRFWRSLGVTRVSVGIQSFSSEVLLSLGRFHDPEAAYRAVECLSEVDMPSWSADLIFAVPGQTIESFVQDVHSLLDRGIPHISLYGLTIEERTVLYKKLRLGRISPVNEEIYATAYLAAHQSLRNAGFIWYEISNWAYPGHECLHNWRYWQRKPYIGLGPSAHSYLPEMRWANRRNLRAYMTDLTRAVYPVDFVEKLSTRDILAEIWLTQFRTRAGVAWSDLTTLDKNTIIRLQNAVRQAEESGWIEQTAEGFCLSPQGALFSDKLAAEFSTIIDSAGIYA